MYYYNARYYDPKLARFITADTIVPIPFYPQSMNRYSYAYNNPIVIVDLNGHCGSFFSSVMSFFSSVAHSVGSFFSGAAHAAVSAGRAIASAATTVARTAVTVTANLAGGVVATAAGLGVGLVTGFNGTAMTKTVDGVMNFFSKGAAVLGGGGIGGEAPSGLGSNPGYIPDGVSEGRDSRIWPLDSKDINSKYGQRSPNDFHSAIDIDAGHYGGPVKATESGEVMKIVTGNPHGRNGDPINYIQAKGGSGFYQTYGHVTAVSSLAVGQAITTGQVIGFVDSSGGSSGPHVHFAVGTGAANSTRFNPIYYLPGN